MLQFQMENLHIKNIVDWVIQVWNVVIIMNIIIIIIII